MFHNDSVAGSWTALMTGLDADDALVRWATAEPVLAGLDSVAELARLTGPHCEPNRADELLGALVRLGSVRGAGDADAVLVLLHLLSDGVEAIAARLGDLSEDAVGLVVGALTVQILAFGGGERGGCRSRAYAANLLLDARRAVLPEVRSGSTPMYRCGSAILVDPLDAAWVARTLDRSVPGPGDNEDAELRDMLLWAERTGVAAATDLAVLVEGERSRDRSRRATDQRQIAARLGIHHSTLRRRRDRAIAALRAARDDYLAA